MTRAHCLRRPHGADGGRQASAPVQGPALAVGPGHERGPDAQRGPDARRGPGDEGGPGSKPGPDLERGPGFEGGSGFESGSGPEPGGAEAGAGTVWGGAPDPGCVCGLYAWRDPATLTAAARPRWTRLPIVVGAVRLGGRIIVGERGLRAELGYPVAVLDPRRVIAPAYQVARYRDWHALTAEWHSEGSEAA
nr:hypothetical protein [Frankia nepalensis]